MESAGHIESEIETLIRTAVGEEQNDGNVLVAAQCYTAALELMVAKTKEVGVHDGFFVAMRPRLLEYLERARLLSDIAIDEEAAAAAAARAARQQSD
jgi:hypothetical protein